MNGSISKRGLSAFLILVMSFSSMLAEAGINDSITMKSENKRIYQTRHIQASAPKIDGVLNDECWLYEGSWSGEYKQYIPKEGSMPTAETEFKILYDESNVYVAIRAYDDPNKIDKRRGRRDDFSGDIVGVCFDSYYDHRTGFEFDLTAAGSKIDLVLMNDGWDTNWDAVWYGETAMEDSAWTAEMQIPLSQLRYSNKKNQVWGMHAWRWINRNQEEDQWNLMPRDNAGFLYSIGELHGISNLPKNQRIELLPYTLGKIHSFKKEEGNPFADGSRKIISAGLDGKIGLTSDFTLDLTINPDFGQVEADPAVLNLSAYETFYEEKRPFFLEGKNITDFEFNGDLLFYSRRIGKQPVYSPETEDNEYINEPENTTILGAVKISGKNKNGLSVSILESLTAQEFAVISDGNLENRLSVEPMTNYLVARVQQDINKSNTMVGGIITATNRISPADHLNDFNKNAYTGGIDFKHFWKDKTYYIEANGIFSHIYGHKKAIYKLQKSSARYFQRPDADYVNLNPSNTHLSGYGAKVKVGKGSNGNWRFSESVTIKSPGLELNDIGYLRQTDLIEQRTEAAYVENEPGAIFREYRIHSGLNSQWNFGGSYLGSYAYLGVNGTFNNKWGISGRLLRSGKSTNNTLLRGGPGVKLKGFWCNNYSIHSDYSKKLGFNFRTHFHVFDDRKSSILDFHPGFQYRINNSLEVSTHFDYSLNTDIFQYVTTKMLHGENEYVLGQLNQETLGLTFRADLALTPDLTLQFYGNPYVSVGKYNRFKQIDNPSAQSYDALYHLLELPLNDENEYVLDEGADITFKNPDFNYSQFRSNFVARWEYKPGSTVYLVWSHARSGHQYMGDYTLSENMNRIFDVYPDNIFLIKLNYWLSI